MEFGSRFHFIFFKTITTIFIVTYARPLRHTKSSSVRDGPCTCGCKSVHVATSWDARRPFRPLPRRTDRATVSEWFSRVTFVQRCARSSFGTLRPVRQRFLTYLYIYIYLIFSFDSFVFLDVFLRLLSRARNERNFSCVAMGRSLALWTKTLSFPSRNSPNKSSKHSITTSINTSSCSIFAPATPTKDKTTPVSTPDVSF